MCAHTHTRAAHIHICTHTCPPTHMNTHMDTHMHTQPKHNTHTHTHPVPGACFPLYRCQLFLFSPNPGGHRWLWSSSPSLDEILDLFSGAEMSHTIPEDRARPTLSTALCSEHHPGRTPAGGSVEMPGVKGWLTTCLHSGVTRTTGSWISGSFQEVLK